MYVCTEDEPQSPRSLLSSRKEYSFGDQTNTYLHKGRAPFCRASQTPFSSSAATAAHNFLQFSRCKLCQGSLAKVAVFLFRCCHGRRVCLSISMLLLHACLSFHADCPVLGSDGMHYFHCMLARRLQQLTNPCTWCNSL